MKSRRPAPGRLLWAAILILAPSGCGRVFGPEALPKATIRGRIHLDGRSLGVGWLEIVPVDGTLGVLRTAQVALDGSFVADGVPVGEIAMKIAGRPVAGTGNPEIDGFLRQLQRQPGILRAVRAGENPPIDIDLRTERSKLAAALQSPR